MMNSHHSGFFYILNIDDGELSELFFEKELRYILIKKKIYKVRLITENKNSVLSLFIYNN